MDLLKRYIKEILKEDLEGFLKDTSGIRYMAGSTAMATFDKTQERQAKRLKTAWAKNADHAFMKSLNKVHWLSHGSGLTARFEWFLNNPGKDEVSTVAYLPGKPMRGLWGSVGVLLDGRVTLAANSMDAIISGYSYDFTPEMLDKYKSSGVPKRAGGYTPGMGTVYVLDAKSFMESKAEDNEFIVDNWKVKALVLSKYYVDEDSDKIAKMVSLAKQNGIPVVDQDGKEFTPA